LTKNLSLIPLTLGILTVACAAQTPYRNPSIISLPQYDLSVRVLPEKQRLEVTGTIRLPKADAPRAELRLVLSNLMRDFQIEVLEPAISAGPSKLDQGELRGRGLKWIVRPSQPIPPNESVLLRFSYMGGEQAASNFTLGPEVAYASAWGAGWYPLIDSLNNKGVGALKLSVPDGYTVKASGTQQEVQEESGRGVFRFAVSRPTYFSFIAGKYTVVRQSGPIPVAAYVLRPRQNLDKYVDVISKTLNLLAREFGPYPFGEFAITEIPSEQSRKAGFNGASLDGFMVTENRALDVGIDLVLAAISHEICHQWWPHLVGVRAPAHMIVEALAQYGSLLTVEALQGAAAAERYRRIGVPSYSIEFSGLGYLKMAEAGFDAPLAATPSNFGVSQRLAYNKGFFMWDMLARAIGREKFRTVMNNITTRYAFQEVTWDELKRAIENGAGMDLKWFFEQWFERTGAPDLRLTWEQDGDRVRGVISQPSPYYRASVEMRIIGDDGRRQAHAVEIRGPRTAFDWPVRFPVQSVLLDPHFLVLRWTPEYRTLATALVPLTLIQVNPDLSQADKIEKELSEAIGRAPSPDLHGVRFMLEYGWGLLFFYQGRWKEVKLHYEAALASPTRVEGMLPEVYLQLAQAAKELHDDATLRWAAESAISADITTGINTGVRDAARALLSR
jgi:Peptidase family M1 domain